MGNLEVWLELLLFYPPPLPTAHIDAAQRAASMKTTGLGRGNQSRAGALREIMLWHAHTMPLNGVHPCAVNDDLALAGQPGMHPTVVCQVFMPSETHPPTHPPTIAV